MSVTRVAVSHTLVRTGHDAGAFLAQDLSAKLDGQAPDVAIVFASPQYSYTALLESIEQGLRPGLLVGCSSAGEFTGHANGDGSVSVMAIRADDMRFHAALGRGLRASQDSVVEQLTPAFAAASHPDFPHRCALVLTDALAGDNEQLVEALTLRSGGSYQLCGGGAADDARFQQTHVFFGTEAVEDAAVVLGMLSKRPLGLGVRHGWEPAGEPLRVTEAEGNRIISINAIPAGEVFAAHARRTGQRFAPADPLPFFLHNVIGIDTGNGYRLRVPLALLADGSIACAAAVPQGATIRLMATGASSASAAAAHASRAALEALQGAPLAGSLVFDCAATRLRLGRGFADETLAVAEALGSHNLAGCNTYGQIARTEGQFSGFHNCTAIVCAIPE